MVDQFLLDLPVRSALGREDFFVAPCNAAPVAWIDRWPDWPRGPAGRALALHGPKDSGKSHLAQVWRAKSKAQTLRLCDLRRADAPHWAKTALALEHDDEAPYDAQALFHLINFMAEEDQGLLIFSRRPPARWSCDLPDLRSRLAALPAVAIDPPDDALIAQLLVKHFADRQLRVDAELVSYLLPRIERSFAAANALVARLDALSLRDKRPITLALARTALNTLD